MCRIQIPPLLVYIFHFHIYKHNRWPCSLEFSRSNIWTPEVCRLERWTVLLWSHHLGPSHNRCLKMDTSYTCDRWNQCWSCMNDDVCSFSLVLTPEAWDITSYNENQAYACSDVTHQINDPLLSPVYGTYFKFTIVSFMLVALGQHSKATFTVMWNFWQQLHAHCTGLMTVSLQRISRSSKE